MRTSRKTICDKYARAFMSSGGDFKARRTELAWAAENLSAGLAALSHPCLNPGVKFEILSRMLGAKYAGTALENFLKLLVVNKRISLLKEIALRAGEIADEMAGLKKAKVSSRFALSESETAGIKEALSSLTGRKIIVENEIREELIGGLQIKIDDLLIDGSVRGRLEGLRKKTFA